MHPSSRLTGLPELTGVRLRWFSDWYDGPVTGLATHDGREYWFVTVTDDEGEHWDFDPRVYVLHELTPAQLAEERLAHRSFAALDLPGCLHTPRCPATPGDDDLAALYARWPPEREDAYLRAPAVGWCRDGS